MSHQDWLAFAHHLADLAAKETVARFRAPLEVDNKVAHGFDPVTEADRIAEREIQDAIKAKYPAHAIWGEEFSGATALQEDAETWVIDPIDGTRAFITGLPSWGTLIGLYKGQTPYLGLADQPITGDRFFASVDGAFLQRPSGTISISTRACSSLEDAIIASTLPEQYETDHEIKVWQTISQTAKLVRWGGDWYNYALLAAGYIDAVIECRLAAYDILPLRPIIEHAGGVITTWQGQDVIKGGNVVAAGDPRLHAQLIELLAD